MQTADPNGYDSKATTDRYDRAMLTVTDREMAILNNTRAQLDVVGDIIAEMERRLHLVNVGLDATRRELALAWANIAERNTAGDIGTRRPTPLGTS